VLQILPNRYGPKYDQASNHSNQVQHKYSQQQLPLLIPHTKANYPKAMLPLAFLVLHIAKHDQGMPLAFYGNK
jgi:hypothetical protein